MRGIKSIGLVRHRARNCFPRPRRSPNKPKQNGMVESVAISNELKPKKKSQLHNKNEWLFP